MVHRIFLRIIARYLGPHTAYSDLATESVNEVIKEEELQLQLICEHVSSGHLRYDREQGFLVLEVVCDLCDTILASTEGDAYEPKPMIGYPS